MDLTHSPRHTRRGFLRGDSAPKFFPIELKSAPDKDSALDFRPPSSPQPYADAPGLMPPPPSESIDFAPSRLADIEASLAAPNGNAFLSWLAEQLEGKAGEEHDAYDDIGDQSLFAWEDERNDDVFGCDFNAAYAAVEDEPEVAFVALPNPGRPREEPRVEVSPDGWRVESFSVGSKIVKDVLGRVIEVHSQFGDCLYFRYGSSGYIEAFERVLANGANHSEGKRDRHGVVVRNSEGRVRAAGESMSVDPRGCFYLHTFDGQFFSVDLVTGIHVERRKVNDDYGTSRFVTSLFAHDGFRMATMFSAAKRGTEYGADRASRFRFYGRDGTLIEFLTEDDLYQLRPVRVCQPATYKLCKTWPNRRQAKTAWDAVHEYLMRVS